MDKSLLSNINNLEFDTKLDKSMWVPLVSKYHNPQALKSWWQIINTFVPYFVLWVVMYFSLQYSYWLTLALAPITAGLSVRIFIIQHDCGHSAFFKSKQLSDFIGSICGVITLTPYHYWRKLHAIHHASAGDLEHRGIGDVYTMTVQEYLEASWWGKFKYRVYRNPFVLFVIAPTLMFLILHRFIKPGAKINRKERLSVHLTNLAIVSIFIIMAYTIGVKAFVLIYTPILIISSTAGLWLFFVQHQFEETYWATENEWDYALAALKGSSYYKLPKVLQWFTGNIGFHHIHHLSPRIPNYLLEKCHKENPLFQQVTVLTLWSSLKSTFLALWDENQKKLVSFGYIKVFKQMGN